MDTQSKMKFEAVLTAPLGEIYNDVLYLVFMRNPVIKSASYVLLRVNLSMILIRQMMNDLAANQYYNYSLQIYIIEEENNDRIKLLHDKSYKILNIKPYEQFSDSKSEIAVQLLLVNPILHYMSTTNTYNRILTNIIPYDAINDFEKTIKNTYGDCFSFNQIGNSIQKNSTTYEQMLIPSTLSDINIPWYIINTYKPFHSYNFYFFDDFCLTAEFDKDIVCHHLNIYDVDQFKQFDIFPYPDISSYTNFIGKSAFSDPFNQLNKTSEVTTFINSEMVSDTIKGQNSFVPHLESGNVTEEKLMEEREIKVTSSYQLQEKNISQTSQFNNFYIPDSKENAQSRVDISRETINEKIDSLIHFETTVCLPDFPQFGKIYNMESDNKTEFLYTPVNIINMFVRISFRENYLKHWSKYSMLKFISPEDLES